MSDGFNIADRLTDHARLRPSSTALVVPKVGQDGTRFDFQKLAQFSDDVAGGLRRRGIQDGMRVVVMVPPGIDFAVLTYAIMKSGAVPVFIDPGMGMRGLGQCFQDAEPQAFIGSTKAVLAKRMLGWGRVTCKTTIMLGPRILGGTSLDQLGRGNVSESLPFRSADDLAGILFTSGSTGPAKGAVYTHGMFQDQVRVLREVFAIEPGEVDLCTFPLFALFAPALGMMSVVPDMDPTRPANADPKKLVQAILDHRVTNIFGSPALIRVLAEYGALTGLKLPTVRRVISAGAPVPASVIARMCQMLPPGTQVWTPYGATEALPVAVIGSDEILKETRYETDRGAGICVGRPVGHVEVRIIPINDARLIGMPEPVPTGEIGEITVRGPVVSAKYWNRPDANNLHKIADGDTVWHRMGDVGYFDDRGRLWFCGRKSHRVMVGNETLFTIPCEAAFNAHPAVLRSALVRAHDRPAICVELNTGYTASPKLLDELRGLRDTFPPSRHITDVLVYPRPFPVDIRHNAKIDREYLGNWAAGRVK